MLLLIPAKRFHNVKDEKMEYVNIVREEIPKRSLALINTEIPLAAIDLVLGERRQSRQMMLGQMCLRFTRHCWVLFVWTIKF